MRAGRRRTLVGAGFALVLFFLDAPAAMAQLVQSDVESDAATTETTQLVTSSTEVRRSVIGLIALAVVVALLGVLYWHKTGRLAAERHTHRYGGKHGERAGTSVGGPPSVPVPAVRTDTVGASFAVQPQPTQVPTTAPAQRSTEGLGGYGTWSTAPEPIPGASPATMGYAAVPAAASPVTAHAALPQSPVTPDVVRSQPPVTAHAAPPQSPVTSAHPVWHDQGPAAGAQARPVVSSVPSVATPTRYSDEVQPVAVGDHRPARREPPARLQHRQTDDHRTQSASRPEPNRPSAQREPARSTPSPYPDASAADTAIDAGGLWSTLRRDLFG